MSVLVVTNSTDSTADYVLQQLSEKQVPFVRLNTDKFLTDVSYSFNISSKTPFNIELKIDENTTGISSIDSVWYRRPTDPIPDNIITHPEAKKFCIIETNYFLKCLYSFLEDRVWISHPKSIAYANVKLHQLEMARHLGFSIPKSICTNSPQEALSFINNSKSVVVKPFKANVIGEGESTAVIYTSKVNPETLSKDIISTIKLAPTFLQEEIKKVREYRVTIIGEDAFVTSIDSQSDPNLALDWRSTSNKLKVWSVDTVPSNIINKCFAMVKAYDLKFGAFDLALTPKGKFVFFELNPNGQWAWQEIQLGLPMTNSLIKTLGH